MPNSEEGPPSDRFSNDSFFNTVFVLADGVKRGSWAPISSSPGRALKRCLTPGSLH